MLSVIFRYLSAKVVGPVSEEVWAQAVTLDNLQVVLVLTGGENRELGHSLLRFLEEEEQKLKKRNLAELSGLLEKIQERIPAESQFSLIMALPVGKVLYLACRGGAAFLKRKESFVKLVEGEEKASGFLEDGDLLILGSEQFFQIITPQVLAENLDHFPPEEISERLAPKISEVEENAGCAALILNFQKREEDWPEETIEESERLNFLPGILAKIRFRPAFRFSIPRPPRLSDGGIDSGRKKTLLTVALFLILMLVLSVFLGVNKTRESEQTKKFDQLYQEVNSKFEEGKGLVGLNDALARARLTEVRQRLEEMENLPSLKNGQKGKIEELGGKIKENLVVLSRVYKVGPLPLFWETSLIKPGSEGENLAIFEDQMAILDRKNYLIFLLAAKTKAAKVLGEDLKDEPRLLGIHGENTYTLTKEGVVRLDAKNKNQKVVPVDSAWGEINSLAAYGGNLYLLDRGRNSENESLAGQVWRYTATENGFSPKRPYFTADIKPDLSRAQDMAIDGSIWVLLPGEILKFNQGRPDSFVISGLEESLREPQALFTNEKNKNLYLLDSQNKKVLVLAKDGVYQAQYEAEEIGQARDLVVSEEEKKIFLLAGSKIYAIEIK